MDECAAGQNAFFSGPDDDEMRHVRSGRHFCADREPDRAGVGIELRVEDFVGDGDGGFRKILDLIRHVDRRRRRDRVLRQLGIHAHITFAAEGSFRIFEIDARGHRRRRGDHGCCHCCKERLRRLHGTLQPEGDQSIFKTARKASCGISTFPTRFIRFFPSFCFSRSFLLREMSPP